MDPWEAITQSLGLNDHTLLRIKSLLLNLCNCNSLVQSFFFFFGVLQQSLIDLSLWFDWFSEERLKSDSIEDGLACYQSSAAFSPSICLHIKKQKRGMHCLYALRIKRQEIRDIQIKYARTTLTCINEEAMSTVLMTKDLRLPCEKGIRNALQEMLITVAHTDSYLCECTYRHTLWNRDREKCKVHAQGSVC